MHNKGTNQRNSALIVVLHLKATMGVLLINTILRITHDILKKYVLKRDMSGGGDPQIYYLVHTARLWNNRHYEHS